MESKEQHTTRASDIERLLKKYYAGPEGQKRLAAIRRYMLQPGPFPTSQVSTATPVLQARCSCYGPPPQGTFGCKLHCTHLSSYVGQPCISCGSKLMALAGHDPNDLQCCDTSKSNIKVYIDGRDHTPTCWKTKLWERANYVDFHESSDCDHEYVSYMGLRESFEYCKKCDQKKC